MKCQIIHLPEWTWPLLRKPWIEKAVDWAAGKFDWEVDCWDAEPQPTSRWWLNAKSRSGIRP